MDTRFTLIAHELHRCDQWSDVRNSNYIAFDADKFVTQQKQGFSVNTANLWKNHGQKLCKYYLTDARIIKEGWINYEWISKYLANNELDVRIINKFLGLLAFEIWYRLFISNEMKPDELLDM